MATVKNSSKKFATEVTGFGLTGMRLNLNLAQCQALAFHYRELTEMLKSDSKDLGSAVQPLIPFLELFKDIQTPMSPDLWVNEDPIREERENSIGSKASVSDY